MAKETDTETVYAVVGDTWKAGAGPDSVQIIDVEDVPLAYLPGNATKIRVKAVGELVLNER